MSCFHLTPAIILRTHLMKLLGKFWKCFCKSTTFVFIFFPEKILHIHSHIL